MTHNPHAIESLSISKLHPHAGNARQHSKKQIDQIAKSIERFGFTNPVFISDDGEIIAGHGRVLAASKLGMDSVPTLRLSHLSKDESRAYVLADNQLALNAGWDRELPAIELQGRIDIDFDLDLMGFSQAEIDFTLDFAQNASTIPSDESADFVPEVATTAVTRRGDVWLLGSH